MHLAIYRKYPKVKAIVHTHSPYATVWSKTRRPFQSKTVEGLIVLGEIPVVCGAKPGSKELAEMVVEKLKNKRAVLLENHGSVSVGPSLDEAFNLAETIEETTKIEIMATILTKNL